MAATAKFIFRDNETGRLITRQEADTRDPSTFTMEKFVMDDRGHHIGHGITGGQTPDPHISAEDESPES